MTEYYNKIVNDWVKRNLFFIHEYALFPNKELYDKITKDLGDVLYNKRSNIKTNITTKFGERIYIDYRPPYNRFTVDILPKKVELRARKIPEVK